MDFVYHEVVVSERGGHVEVVVSVVDCGTGSQTEGVVATETSERTMKIEKNMLRPYNGLGSENVI